MKIEVPKEVLGIINKLESSGFEVYIVGGAVRDILQKKEVTDWDFTTNAKPEEVLKLFLDAIYDDSQFGTVILPGQNENIYHITTFRTEHGYSDARRPDKIEWGKSLEEDLKRRDFTINAMALAVGETEKLKKKHLGGGRMDSSEVECELIDPFNGQKDSKDKIIRAVGKPSERFSEDALRMTRAIRISSELGFKIEEKTFNAIKKNASSINKISKERVRDELLKILASPNPYQGMEMFRESGLMQEILPGLVETFGVEQASPGRHHIYDVGTHSMLSLKNVAERNTDPIVRLATLLHDVGKAQTYKKLKTGTITFYNHELVSAKIAKRIAKRLKFSKKQADKLWKLVRWHQFTVDERQTDSALRRFIRNVGIENVPDMLDLRVGDRLGGGARETSWRLEEFKKRLIEVQKQPFTVHDLKISGHEVMKELGIKPGPKVGEILQNLYEEVVDKKLDNTKKALMKRLEESKD